MAIEETSQNTSTGSNRAVVLGIATIFLTYFTYSYFFQILLSALPRIIGKLESAHLYDWAVSIPNLGLAFSMLLIGKFSNMYGRRTMLMITLSICLVGAVWCALSDTYMTFIISRTFLAIGQGAIAPLCFAALGDMFEAGARSKWVGMLNIPSGILATFGPTLGGWFVDNPSLGWHYIFWCGVPLLVLSLVMAVWALPKHKRTTTPSIDGWGALLAAAASSTLILAFSMAGKIYPWGSLRVIGCFILSAIFWYLFIKTEGIAKEPIFDLQILKNRSFIIITIACLLSCFGMAGLMVYYPVLIQGIQKVSATDNALIMTPGNILMHFLGFPAGFILARTRKYKWMFLLGYGLTAAVMLGVLFFNADTKLIWGFLAFTMAGIGMGAIPTLNTLAVQYAVPRRFLSVATGGLFFCVMLGQAIAPAVLGSAQTMRYESALAARLPSELDEELRASIRNPSVLLNESAMVKLKESLGKSDPGGGAALEKRTIEAINLAFEDGLKIIFIIGAIAMTLTFLSICLLPGLSIDAKPVEDDGP